MEYDCLAAHLHMLTILESDECTLKKKKKNHLLQHSTLDQDHRILKSFKVMQDDARRRWIEFQMSSEKTKTFGHY